VSDWPGAAMMAGETSHSASDLAGDGETHAVVTKSSGLGPHGVRNSS